MEDETKSNDYWNGAIDAFCSEGYDSEEICNMIINMGCPIDEALAFCGLEECRTKEDVMN